MKWLYMPIDRHLARPFRGLDSKIDSKTLISVLVGAC